MKIFKESKIYIISPLNKTGGVECLHQLCDILNKNKLNAGMIYPNSVKNKLYPQYNYKVFNEIEDFKENILIVPEIYPDYLDKYKRIQKGIWWLSFYNAPLEKYLYHFREPFIFINKVFRKFIPKLHKKVTISLFRHKTSLLKKFYSINHFCQSKYVFQELKNKEIKDMKMLEDYIFLPVNRKNDKIKKENLIAYNPKKGFKFTKKIIKNNPNLKFIPLINMTKKELYSTLKKSKVYIDFGNHPGRDKIPREAILNNCLVITNKKGSANNEFDVPIPYKINEKNNNLKDISFKLKYLLKNYKLEIGKYQTYKKIVLGGKEKMRAQVNKIFIKKKQLNQKYL